MLSTVGLCAIEILLIGAETLKATGYVGKEVILKCQLAPGSENITQVQWEFESTIILVFNTQHGKSIKDSQLKERLDLTEQSLKIKDVKITDSGTYTCTVTTYPSGSLKETIELVVKLFNFLTFAQQIIINTK
uniref:Ig-like domain-containing protein n=1 Tax=Xiphophorus maculatus TaxID=8083 RepID=A0A3B5R8Z3_XIPMA